MCLHRRSLQIILASAAIQYWMEADLMARTQGEHKLGFLSGSIVLAARAPYVQS